jgi:hypothetical protein
MITLRPHDPRSLRQILRDDGAPFYSLEPDALVLVHAIQRVICGLGTPDDFARFTRASARRGIIPPESRRGGGIPAPVA